MRDQPEKFILKGKEAEQNFDTLFREYYKTLCRVVYKIAGDESASEDIVQDVFIKLWKNREKLDIHTSIYSYLHRSSVNTALNYLKKQKRIKHLDENIENTSGSHEPTSSSIEYKEIETNVKTAIDSLPPTTKAIFIMSRYEDKTYKEIADNLGVTVKAIEYHMGKALKTLKSKLSAHLKRLNSIFF